MRSPGEFARGAVPGATSVPLLDDAERHEVGLLYKTVGRVEATQLGLELFAAKVERFIETVLGIAARTAPGTTVYVHCWRGGQRSQTVAALLRALGIPSVALKGGYKAYRNDVLATLADFATRDLLVLDGRTGVGKSELLRLLKAQDPGFPLVDFEAHARHRGSAFGDFAQAEPVPTQQDFENQLAETYLRVGPAPRLLVEIENFIGPLALPEALRDRVYAAPTVLLERDFDDRVERLAAEYAAGWSEADDQRFEERCQMLRRHVAATDLAEIIAATKRRDFRTATSLLLKLRYDKVYDKGLAKRAAQVCARFNLTHERDAALAYLRQACGTGFAPPKG